MKQTFRVAVIGCGAISGNHISGLLQAKQEICALCDLIPERAQAQAEKYGLTRAAVYTDYKELLQKERPDSIHICLPHDLHVPVAVEALNARINVLCEKPAGISMRQLQILLAAEKESPAQLGICLQNRYEPNFRRLKESLTGNVVSAAGTVFWKRDEDYYSKDAWHGTLAHEGGGVAINQALHTLDLLQWLCGMPRFVTAHCSNDHLKNVIEVEDTASALFELENGRKFNFFATTSCGCSFPAQLQLRTENKDTFVVSGKLFSVNGVSETGNSRKGIGKSVWGIGHGLLIEDFYRCLSEGRPFPIDGREGAKVMRLILAMYCSEGRRIAVPEL